MAVGSKYFSPDYNTARARLLEAAKKARGRLESLELDAKGPSGEALTIDIAWFGAERPRRVLVHSSGLHGVEGFAGSAIQLQWLEEGIPQVSEDAAIVLVHILNPYGMAWLRRSNENNVDLNRNFLGGREYSGAPEAYPKLDSFLNPQSSPSRDLYLLKAGWLILRYGFPALKQAVAGGQYEYPRGLFFGGKQLQQGSEKYQAFIAQRLQSAEQIIAIDIHTGLGKYCQDTLLVEPNDYAVLRPIFGERVVPSEPQESPAYRVRGSINTVFSRILPHARAYSITQEFGTYSSVKVLQALREENRWHHCGGGALGHPTKARLLEVFCPKDENWRQSILRRGAELIREAVPAAFEQSKRGPL